MTWWYVHFLFYFQNDVQFCSALSEVASPSVTISEPDFRGINNFSAKIYAFHRHVFKAPALYTCISSDVRSVVIDCDCKPA